MSAYHQMGHDSRNLLSEPGLSSFEGAILSPVNENETQMLRILEERPENIEEFVFDPQLYYPNSERGYLPNWQYFPADVDTADQSSMAWWQDINSSLIATIQRIGADGIFSPNIVPKIHSDDYYVLNRQIADDLVKKLNGGNVVVHQTLLVKLADVSDAAKAATIASIASGCSTDRVYLNSFS